MLHFKSINVNNVKDLQELIKFYDNIYSKERMGILTLDTIVDYLTSCQFDAEWTYRCVLCYYVDEIVGGILYHQFNVPKTIVVDGVFVSETVRRSNLHIGRNLYTSTYVDGYRRYAIIPDVRTFDLSERSFMYFCNSVKLRVIPFTHVDMLWLVEAETTMHTNLVDTLIKYYSVTDNATEGEYRVAQAEEPLTTKSVLTTAIKIYPTSFVYLKTDTPVGIKPTNGMYEVLLEEPIGDSTYEILDAREMYINGIDFYYDSGKYYCTNIIDRFIK